MFLCAGKPDIDSDIDLAVIFSQLIDAERFDIQVQLLLTASQFDSRIEPHPFSVDDFYSGNPFAEEIKRTGLELLADASSCTGRKQLL